MSRTDPNTEQHIHLVISVHIYYTLADTLGIVSLAALGVVELGCERKSAGSRGIEPCHPVVTGHTCLLFPESVKS